MVTISTPLGSDGLISSSFSLTRSMTFRAFSPARMMTMPPTVSPSPSRSAIPRRISGPRVTEPRFLTRMGVPCLSVPTTICSMSCDALHIAPPADHVLRAAELDQPPAHVVVAVPNRLDHGGDRDVEGQQLGGIDVDLVLLLKSADRGHLGHAGHRLELVAEIPVLETPQLGQIVLAGLVHQGVLIDPAHARGIRA